MSGEQTFRDPGQLAHRIVLERGDEVTDGQGGLSVAWTQIDQVWAHLKPLSARALLLAEQQQEETTHRLVMRHRADVSSGWRARMGYRTFRILTVHDPDERGRYIECLAAEDGR